MKCSKCFREIPDGSEFCSYCGSAQEEKLFCRKCGRELFSDSDFCQFCGASVANANSNPHYRDDESFGNDKTDKTKKTLNKSKIIAIILAAVCVLLLAGNIYQYVSNGNRIKELSKEVNSFDQVLRDNNIGYASENFKTDTPIVSVKKGEDKTINVTAFWEGGANVTITSSNHNIALASFDSQHWDETASVTVHGYYEGNCIITFDNSFDITSFDIFVIVKP